MSVNRIPDRNRRTNRSCLASIPVLAQLLAAGASHETLTTTRASVGAGGAQANGESNGVALSGEGRWVAFTSAASNLVPGDTNEVPDVFLKDRLDGSIVRVSVSSAGDQANGESRCASISGDGRRVVFVSDASNLVTDDSNEVGDVFVRDLEAGTTLRVSKPTNGGQADLDSSAPAISADGHLVAFSSRATNLVPGDANGASDVFVHDLATGILECVSLGVAGVPSDGASEGPALGANGRFVAFASLASNLPAAGQDTNRAWDVFVKDRSEGTLVRASLGTAGAEGNGHSFSATLSADGTIVGFASYATNLVAGDTNKHIDVFVRDRVAETTLRVSLSSEGGQSDGDSQWPRLSADGSRITFESRARNLVAGATLARKDVFLHFRTAGTTLRISQTDSGAGAGEGSAQPVLSSDGRWVAFSSAAANLVAGDDNATEDVFLRGPFP